MSGAVQQTTGPTNGTQTPPPQTTPSDVPPGTAAPVPDWVQGLSPELRQVVEVKGYKTPGDVVQAYAHAQRAIGADKITLPNKDTGEWDADARQRLGIPDKPEGYQLQRPASLPPGMQYDEKFEQAALPVAHKLGLTPKQIQGLMDFYSSHQGNAYAEAVNAMSQDQTTAMAALKNEYGTSYDVQIQRAQVAARFYGGDALVSFLNRTGLGNNPDLVRAFAKIGGAMSEDQLKTGQGMTFGLTPAQAKAEAAKLMHTEAYNKNDHPEHAAVVEKVQALFEQAYPSNR